MGSLRNAPFTEKAVYNFFKSSANTLGRTEVRWRPGQETSLAPPCSNLRSFGNKCTALKKYLRHCWDLSAPPSVSAPGALCPLCPPSLRPRLTLQNYIINLLASFFPNAFSWFVFLNCNKTMQKLWCGSRLLVYTKQDPINPNESTNAVPKDGGRPIRKQTLNRHHTS